MITIINENKNIFHSMKNNLLSALFERNFSQFEEDYKKVFRFLSNSTPLSEEDQKTLNQIQQLVRKVGKEIHLKCSPDILSYKKSIQKHLSDVVKQQMKSIEYVDWVSWRKTLGLNDASYRTLLNTVTSFQLSSGCRNFCKRCNEWALPGIRKHFCASSVLKIAVEIHNAGNNEFVFYGASDPLDWEDGSTTIVDIISSLFQKGYQAKYGLLTKISKGKEAVAEKLLEMGADFAVSITAKNRSRVRLLEKKTGKTLNAQHEVEELLIPSGLDEDFESVHPSITDNYGTEITPDGAFIIIPTFTSALNPTGQYRIPVTKDLSFFLSRRTGRDALPVEYYKPLKAVSLAGEEFILDALLVPQIQNILLDNSDYARTPPGMMSFAEFLSTFSEKAILQRKKMIPSVVKEHKDRYFSNRSTGIAVEDQRARYKRAVKNYLDVCSVEKIEPYKRYMFSFYLKEISEYLRAYPSERAIIRFLKHTDKKDIECRYPRLSGGDCPALTQLFGKDINLFDLFQIMLFRLIRDPEDNVVCSFLEQYPAKYNPETDRFVKG